MKLEASPAEMAEFISLGRFAGNLISDEVGKLATLELMIIKSFRDVDDDRKVKIAKVVTEIWAEHREKQKVIELQGDKKSAAQGGNDSTSTALKKKQV